MFAELFVVVLMDGVTIRGRSGRGRPKGSRSVPTVSTRASLRSHTTSTFSDLSDTENDNEMSETAITDLKDELKGFIELKTKHLEGIITEKSNIILSMQTRVDSLEKQLLASVNSNVQLTSRVATLEAKLQKLEVKIDDNEQRGRKMNLRIEGIEFEEGETKGQLKTKILNTLNKMDANINAADICRFHRSGKPRVDRPRGPDGKLLPLPVDPETPVVKVAQTIVKFRHWDARDRAYQAKFVSKAKNFR